MPGDHITLSDQSGNWSAPAGVTYTADVGEPGFVRIAVENLTGGPIVAAPVATIAGIIAAVGTGLAGAAALPVDFTKLNEQQADQ